MSLYILIPLIACVVCAVLATAIVYRDPDDRTNRLAALLIACTSFWALCEVVWSAAREPDIALLAMRASTLGWTWIGPLVLHLFIEISGDPIPRLRRLLPLLYAVSALFIPVAWLGPWMHQGVVPTSWGWGYELGPAYPFYLAFASGCTLTALGLGWLGYRTASPGERAQAVWLGGGVLMVMVVASLTDGLLPLLGVQVPRLGTTSLALLSAGIAWSSHRYGYSLLAPSAFAREILATLPDGVALLRMDGRIRSANGALCELLGRDERDVSGVRITDRLARLDANLADEVSEVECELVDFQNRRVPVAVSTTRLLDRQQAPIGLVLVLRDLGEIAVLRNRVLLSARLAAVGELAAGIAHEINNPLAFVRANLGVLRKDWDELIDSLDRDQLSERLSSALAEGEELIDDSLEGVDRAAAIVRDVKGLSHAGEGRRQLADLNALLDGVLRMAAPQLRQRAVVEKHYGELPRVPCAPQEIQQVFVNLILNAEQAVGSEGHIRISTELTPEAVVVRVEDDGCGIPPEVMDRIFDPFFTTKPVGEGTGLGLPIAFEIVRKHGGDIEVESEPGRGTCFSVRLPIDADTLTSS